VGKNLIRCIEGTRDYFDLDGARFGKAMKAADHVFTAYGYSQIHTPVFEATELFARGIGEATDIVEKEMYTFKPGSDMITLRPEGTAGVIRAFLQHSMHKQGGLNKLWYSGPMFRRERPQKGRQRQFHQVGVEAVGSSDPLLDAEVIAMGLQFYAAVGITGIRTRLNSIGCSAPECRAKYRETLREAIRPNLDKFCKNCQNRFDRNVLRLLDCKNPSCKELAANLPKSHEHVCGECADHFGKVTEALDAFGVDYVIDPTLVRGLDYYTKTVFEYTHSALGAQDAIGGGGRYDGLVEELGGPSIPAVGFAIGVERVMIAMETLGACCCTAPLMVYGIAAGDEEHKAMSGLLARLRRAGVSCDMDFEGKSFKAQMRTAGRRGALIALILGSNELETGQITVKDMREDGGQSTVPLSQMQEAIEALVTVG